MDLFVAGAARFGPGIIRSLADKYDDGQNLYHHDKTYGSRGGGPSTVEEFGALAFAFGSNGYYTSRGKRPGWRGGGRRPPSMWSMEAYDYASPSADWWQPGQAQQHLLLEPTTDRHPTKCTKHGAVPLDKTNTYMKPSARCLTPFQFLDRISERQSSEVNREQLASYKSWIQGALIPRINSQKTGRAVSTAEMKKVISFFGKYVFWNKLNRTRFRWRDIYRNGRMLGETDEGGTLITLDPKPSGVRERTVSLGDDLLSTLLHECCHAILDQQACNGRCWSRDCAVAWRKQIEPHEYHGPAFVKLAKGAQAVANREGLFKCNTGYRNY